MANILSLGLDTNLLETRHAVLRLSGAEVISAKPELAERLIVGQRFALVLICHTLSEEEIESTCRYVAHHSPESQIIVLQKQAGSFREGKRTRTFEWHRGPGALVELAKALLRPSRAGRGPHEGFSLAAQAA